MEKDMKEMKEEITYHKHKKYNDDPEILLLLNSNVLKIANLRNKMTKNLELKINDMCNHESMRTIFCISNKVPFANGVSMGFDESNLDFFENTLIFGTTSNRLSIININNKIKRIDYKIDIGCKRFSSVYSNKYGLIIIGGKQCKNNVDIRNESYPISNTSLYQLVIHDEMKKNVVTKMPYSAIWPSSCLLDDYKLFICGGWWNGFDLNNFCLYDFESKKWNNLRLMNHSHQWNGITYWKEKKSIIVAGGYNQNKNVEQYDINKNIWIDLPNLIKEHEKSPLLKTYNNVIFCIGGVTNTNKNLGFIEFYDTRSNANKWILNGTVEQYLNVKNNATGIGSNCILPL